MKKPWTFFLQNNSTASSFTISGKLDSTALVQMIHSHETLSTCICMHVYCYDQIVLFSVHLNCGPINHFLDGIGGMCPRTHSLCLSSASE